MLQSDNLKMNICQLLHELFCQHKTPGATNVTMQVELLIKAIETNKTT